MKFGPGAAKLGHEFLNPTVGMMPKVRADAVDALNSIRAKWAAPWTAESLFLFFAAFIRTDSELYCDWMRPTDEILALLTRGMSSAQRDDVASLLAVAMSEVPEMIRLVPSASITSKLGDSVSLEDTLAEEYPTIPNGFLAAIQHFVGKAAFTAGFVANQAWHHHDEKLDLAILKKIAESLSQGGLSTIECRTILLEQGLPKDIVFKALQFT